MSLPSENEWYKAAYYNPGMNSYYQYPTSSNATPFASGPTATPNSANYNFAVGNLTDVGAYSGTTSPYGAFDMGGNVYQWNEELISGPFRGLRGGSFASAWSNLLPSERGGGDPAGGGYAVGGFRVASVPIVPEPSTAALAALGFVGLVACGWRGRKR